MQVSSTQTASGLEIKLSFTNDEVEILKSDLNGKQGIIDWFMKGPSREKIFHTAKKLNKSKKEDALFMRKLSQLSEDEYIACMQDPFKFAKKVMAEPDYKDMNTRLTEDAQKHKDLCMKEKEDALLLPDGESKEKILKRCDDHIAYYDSELAMLAAYK